MHGRQLDGVSRIDKAQLELFSNLGVTRRDSGLVMERFERRPIQIKHLRAQSVELREPR
jgi:hypothetical protein